MKSLNGGRPMWGPTEDLLADMWTLTVRVNSEKGSLPDDFDHPVRAEMTARALAEHKRALKEKFEQLKNAYTSP